LEIISYLKFIDLISGKMERIVSKSIFDGEHFLSFLFAIYLHGIIPTVPKLGAFAHPTCGSGVIVRTECLGFRQVRELAQEEDGGEDQTSRWADHV
jgi:hypothetical protein